MLTAFKNKSKNVLKTRPLTSLFFFRMQKMCKGFAGVSLYTEKRPLNTQPVVLKFRESLSFQDLFYKFS